MEDNALLRPARVTPVLRNERELRESLDGEWYFRLDPEDCGVREGWFRSVENLTERIRVPGCWQGQGFGDESEDRLWDFRLEGRVFQATYQGTGWYGRSFNLPAGWTGKRIWLNFGGAHPSAEIWLNGIHLGENSLPFIPFAFDVTDKVQRSSENELVVRVHEKNRQFGLAYSWQGNWSGLYRGVELSATGHCWFKRCTVLPDAKNETLRLRASVGGKIDDHTRLVLRAMPVGMEESQQEIEFKVEEADGEWFMEIPNPMLWSPDDPQLYRVDVELFGKSGLSAARTERTGFVTLEADGKRFCINGEPYYMRGSGDFISCPETGSPDTDRDRWRRKLRTLREYGYNYVRCQSFVYGPEYYDAADEVGLLVQSEMGMLGAWGGHTPWHVYQWPKPTPDNYPILKKQWDLVVERDASHPSANIYCMSNECGADTDFPRVAWECYRDTKALKPTAMVIWTDGGYNKNLPADFINQNVSNFGPAELTELEMPLIEHEYRWWSSFPDVRLREKYSGAVRPYAAKIAADTARCRGQDHLLETYAVNSQRLQLMEARAKMELMRRENPELAGICHFNAMDTNPSPQGIIDEFYERKQASAAEWRRTNGDTVVLCSLGFADRCWTAGSTVEIGFSVSDFAHPPFQNPQLRWRLGSEDETFAEGQLDFSHHPFTTASAGEISLTIPDLTEPTAGFLEAVMIEQDGKREVQNSWKVWLFPESKLPEEMTIYGAPETTWLSAWSTLPRASSLTNKDMNRVLLAESLNDELIAHMHRGGSVILAAGEGLVRPHNPLFGYVKYFFTPPANYGPYEDGQNGTVIADHPLLEGFPHNGYAEWPFFRMMENAPPLDLGPLGLAEGEPVIRVIHRYPTLHPLGYLLQRSVGRGTLIVCGLDLNPDWVEVRWLLAQMCRAAMETCTGDRELEAYTEGRLKECTP
ncbi:MAG: hypothetical protein KGZ25_04585 [Planctomycetes bacterium]|nr:hypothetical protein [Planctomycetota bacterium]